jgi:uncharacterized membrane protein
MERVEMSVNVRCPLRAVYDQWTRFEDFPEFMSGVMEVRQIDDTHVHCHAEIWGEEKELDAEIIEQVPNEHIAWKSMSGTPTVGIVRFVPLGPELTRVQLMIAYNSEAATDDVRDALQALSSRVQETVEDFKWFIEDRDRENRARRRTNIGSGDSNA